MLETLYYPDEIRASRRWTSSGVKISDRELEMAFTLIDILRKPFDPEEYHDHYREALAQLIEAKLEGREVVKAPAAAGDQGHRPGRRAQAQRRGGEEGKPQAAAAGPGPPGARGRQRTRKVS